MVIMLHVILCIEYIPFLFNFITVTVIHTVIVNNVNTSPIIPKTIPIVNDSESELDRSAD